MFRVPIALLLSIAVFAGPETSDEPNKAAADLKKLQGQWTMAALEVNGEVVPPAKLEGTVLTIKDDTYKTDVKGKTTACKLTLDPGKDPKEIDMLFLDGVNKDMTQKGIYKFDGDTFQLARGISAEHERPRDFATWPGTNYFVVTWKKK
jgi:uncharacterized protein (TIGR03067 family)